MGNVDDDERWVRRLAQHTHLHGWRNLTSDDGTTRVKPTLLPAESGKETPGNNVKFCCAVTAHIIFAEIWSLVRDKPAVAAHGAPTVLNAGATSILFAVTMRLSLFHGWAYEDCLQYLRIRSQDRSGSLIATPSDRCSSFFP